MSSFVLKLIAAVSMLCDHAGLILFSEVPELRIAGRLAFPLYAFCIAEGFRHTRNRLRYFLRIFVLGVLCQIVFFIAEKELYLGILITFSFSILLMALVDSVKTAFRGEKSALAAFVERILGKAPSGTADRILSVSLTALFTVFLWFSPPGSRWITDFSGSLFPCSPICSTKRSRAPFRFPAAYWR